MTVATTHAENKFTGDGVQTVFTFTFQVVKTAPNLVVLKSNAVQVGTYTTAINADQEASPGGTVTFSVAPANGAEVIVRRVNPQTQSTDFPLEAKLSTASVEAALDKAYMCVQEVSREIAQKTFRWMGTWSSSVAYLIGDAVAYNGTSYICTTANTNSAPPSANWSTLAIKGDTGYSGLNWTGAWNSGTAYDINDGVSYGGSSYICVTAHTNSVPPSANWNLLATKGTDGSGTGDVVGPASVTDGRVAVFDTTSGKLLKQGTRLESELVAGPASSTANAVPLYSGTGGKTLKDGVAPGTSGNVLTSDGTNWTSAAPAASLVVAKSTAFTVSLGGLATFAHGQGKAPKSCWLIAKCKTADAGFAVNDELMLESASGTAVGFEQRNSMYFDTTNIYVRWSSAGALFAGNKGTGVKTELTLANWDLFVCGLF